jgi:hypothetical protein
VCRLVDVNSFWVLLSMAYCVIIIDYRIQSRDNVSGDGMRPHGKYPSPYILLMAILNPDEG